MRSLKFVLLFGVLIILSGCGGGVGSPFASSSGTGGSSGADSGTEPGVFLAETFDTGSGTDELMTSDPSVPLAHNPEPSTLILLGMGVAGLFAAAKKKKKNS